MKSNREKAFYVVEFLWPKESWWFFVEATKKAALQRGKELEADGFRRMSPGAVCESMNYTIEKKTSYYHGA